MVTRRTTRKTARQRRPQAHTAAISLYRRKLRYEPLEDRRVLSVVTVTTLADSVDFNDGVTSLREAIFAANIVSGADTVDFAPSLTASGAATILLTQGELKITDSLTINGPGADLLTLDASGNDPTPNVNDGRGSRIFNIDDGNGGTQINTSISGLTLTGGDSNLLSQGGAIFTFESLSIQSSAIIDNASGGRGGGIFAILSANSNLMINSTTISENSSRLAGGGICLLTTDSSHAELSYSTISGNSADFAGGAGLYVKETDSSSLTISHSTISDNLANQARGFNGNGGGVRAWLFDSSSMEINSSRISGNSAVLGGGVYARAHQDATATIASSSIHTNSAAGGGGVSAIAYYSSRIAIESSTISGNSAGGDYSAGGVDGRASQFGEILIASSTISGNSASGQLSSGGVAVRIRSEISSFTIAHSVITNNQASSSNNANGSFIFEGTLKVDHSIIAGNASGGDVGLLVETGASIQATHSLIGDNSGTPLAEAPIYSPDASGNLIGGPVHGTIDPMLGPLADNGGPTSTHALLPGSPAINAGDLNAVAGVDGVPHYDQRGEPFNRVANGRIDIGAFEYQQPSDLNLLVDTLADESDGDYSRGDLSLREAIALANLWPSDDTIRFDPALTACGPATILLTRGELGIVDDVTITGLGADLLTIDASGNDTTPTVKDGRGSRIFRIDDAAANAAISISGLRLTGGDAAGNGGAIAGYGNLTLTDMKIEGNATQLSGGGVHSINNNSLVQHTLVIRNSTISGNTARIGGGGVWVHMRRGTMTFEDNLIAGNSATGLDNSTGGGGIYANLRNTSAAIVNNTIRDNLATSGGGIWASNITGQMLIDESHIVGNTAVGHAGQGGGVFFTGDNALATIRDSTVEANSTTGLDSRGGGIFSGGEAVAIERSTIRGNTSGRFGGGIYNTTALQLLESTVAANNAVNTKGIGGGIFHTGNRTMDVVASSISGNSATLNGGGIAMINTSPAASAATIDRSTISGNTAAQDGGGISAQFTRLNLTNSTVAENSAGRDGGGLLLQQSSTTIAGSTISQNLAGGNGGGIASSSHLLTITNSTLSQNRATINGGALWTNLEATLSHTTVAFNRADQVGGGIFVNAGNLLLKNTVIAKNVGAFGPDLSGLLGVSIEAHYSLIGSNAGNGLAPAPVGSPDSNGNMIGGANELIDPLLNGLAANGGPTLTHQPLLGSPLIDAGDPAAVPGIDGVPVHDQRAAPFTRVYGGRIDIGAFELQPNPLPGDYNCDGNVDAADYVLARKLPGTYPAFPAEWIANFGQTIVGQGSIEAYSGASSPEPGAVTIDADSVALSTGEVARGSEKASGSRNDVVMVIGTATNSVRALPAWLDSRVPTRETKPVSIPHERQAKRSRDTAEEVSVVLSAALDRMFEALGAAL